MIIELIVIDLESPWQRITRALAHLNEVTEIGFIKDGDSIIQDPLFSKVQTRKKGKTVFAIKFNRIDQPIFKFGMKSRDRAETLMQQFSILTNLS